MTGTASEAGDPVAALLAEWRRLGEEPPQTEFQLAYRAGIRKCADDLGYALSPPRSVATTNERTKGERAQAERNGTGIVSEQVTRIWFEKGTGSRIYLKPVSGGGTGWTVKLASAALPPNDDYLRESYHSDTPLALQEVEARMGKVPGEWVKIPDRMEAT